MSSISESGMVGESSEDAPSGGGAKGTLNGSRSAALRRMERALGLPSGLLERLLAADDWTCVIALQALLEAALGAMLAGGETGVARLAAKLPLGGTAASKLGVADALDLADDRALRFVRQLTELRGRLVGNLDALDTDLGAEVAALPPARRRWLLDGYWAPLNEADPLAAPGRERSFAAEPRLVLLLGTCAAIARLMGGGVGEGAERKPIEVVEEAAHLLLDEESRESTER